MDDGERIIMLLFGVMDHGGPFWCYVAVKPIKYEDFKAAQSAGQIDLYNFDEFGEVVVSAEGKEPPWEITQKVAEHYSTNPLSFFQNIDPIAAIKERLDDLSVENYAGVPEKPGGWAAKVGRRGSR